jgi:hypothetical protein
MECGVKLEAKFGWGEVETIEVGKIVRRLVSLTAEEVGLNRQRQGPSMRARRAAGAAEADGGTLDMRPFLSRLHEASVAE